MSAGNNSEWPDFEDRTYGFLNDLLDIIPEPDPEKCSDIQRNGNEYDYECEGDGCMQCLCDTLRNLINEKLAKGI